MTPLQTPRIINPFAPPAYNGVLNATPDGWVDRVYHVPFNVTMAALTFRDNLARDVPTDGDFIWRSTIANTQTGAYSVKFKDAQGYEFSNGLIHYLNLSATGAAPAANGKEVMIPAGGQIGIEIQELSGAENVIQIVFKGVMRYKL